MKILHVCLACFYIDHYTYQENILPKYHHLMGNDVTIIASTESFDQNGNLTYVESGEYINEDGIKVIRLPYVEYMPPKIVRKLRRYKGLSERLNEISPDFIFLHDIQFLDIDKIVKYAKSHRVKIVADCHADFSNSARSFLSREILHKIIYKGCAKKIEPYCEKFYGVLPARCDFLRNVYGIDNKKIDLLVMGVEDEKAEHYTNEEVKTDNRTKLGIAKDDFVIAFGGKIDKAKKQVLLLMDAINEIDNQSIKLILFGSIIPEMKKDVENRLSDRIKYLGWADSDQAYEYFGLSDVACFPGRHSVFWEQVAGMGIPLIVKRWAGTTHIDVGGNVIFLDKDDKTEIENSIMIMKDNYSYYKNNALKKKNVFSYSQIAKKCIDCK